MDATGTTHFGGLNHFDQRTAGTGAYANTQFNLEPPDQGLCVGKGFVVETVNTAIRVRSAATGALITQAMPLNQFIPGWVEGVQQSEKPELIRFRCADRGVEQEMMTRRRGKKYRGAQRPAASRGAHHFGDLGVTEHALQFDLMPCLAL